MTENRVKFFTFILETFIIEIFLNKYEASLAIKKRAL